MLRCPFCDADLGGESNRLRGGRCPKCGSILSWDDDESQPEAGPTNLPSLLATLPPASSDDDDAISMKDIVRTIVQRAAPPSPQSPPPSISATVNLGNTPIVKRPPPPLPRPASTSDSILPPPDSSTPSEFGGEAPELQKMWKGSLTVASKPSMTLKAASAEPDPAISDLLIRPCRIGQPGDAADTGAEYELQEVIGEGGVGVVYAARQASIDRTVALKVLRDEFAHKRDHRNKFLSEAVVTGELDHPNIVPIYDLGTSDLGSLFYAMKRVRGTPWSDVIREQSLAENLRILMSVADAIAFAHSRGVIHRDLKPENVMLGDFGEVLVMDWGIALSTNMFVKSDRISQSTSMGGTPAYMAPEMATGPLDRIGPSSDVYLLGAMLFEIITGRTPHTGKDVMTCLYAAAKNEIQPTEKTGELLDIAYKAMSTSPDKRHASVQEFQAAIREYQSHSESIVLSNRADEELAQARRTQDYQDYARSLFAFQEARSLWSANERAKSGELEARLAYAATALEKEDYDLGVSLLDERYAEQAALRKKLVAAQRERSARQARIKGLRQIAVGLAASIIVMLTVGLVFIARQYRTISETNEQLTTEKERTDKLNTSLQSSYQALNSEKEKTDSLNTNLQSSNQALSVATRLAASEAKAAREAQEDEAGASYLAQIGVAAERIANNSFHDAERLLAEYAPPRSPWSYFRHWEWGHLQWLTGREAAQLNVGPRIESLARSADGRLVAAGTASGQALIWEVDWTGRTFKKVGEVSFGGPVLAITLSPDGQRLAAGGDFDRGAIALCQRTEAGYQKEEQRLAGHAAGVLSLAFSPRGDKVLSSSRDGMARLWSLATRQSERSFFGHSGPVWAATFSPDGQQVVTAGDDASVRLWRIGEETPRVYRGHEGPVYAVAFAPQGGWIASGGRDRDVHLWRAEKDLRIKYDEIAKDLEQQRRGEKQAQSRAAFHSPDYRLRGHAGDIRALAFSSDGALVLSGAHDNTVRRWAFQVEAQRPEHMTTFRGHGGWIRGCVLALDPRYAVSGSLDGFVKLWDADEYEEVRALRNHEDAVNWAAFSRDGQRIVTASRDRRALMWNLSSREPVLALDEDDAAGNRAGSPAARLEEGHDFLATSGAFFPDDRHVVTSAGDGTVRIWDRTTGGQTRRITNTGTLGVLALSSDGRWLLTGSDTTDAQLWRADDPSIPAVRLSGHPGEIAAAGFAATSDSERPRIVTGDVLGNVKVWSYDPASKAARSDLNLAGHTQGYGITAVAFTTGGRRVLSACQDHTVLAHDAVSGERLPLILRHPDSVRAMQVSADGTRAITISSPKKDHYRVSLWDLASGAERSCEANLPGETLTSVTFFPDQRGAILASTGRNKSRLWRWDLASPSLAPLWPGRELRGAVWSATICHAAAHVLVVGGSQARMLTADRGELEKTFSPHGPVTGADFSPLGRLVATCSSDGDVKLWSADPADADYGRVVLRMIHPHATANGWAGLNFVAFAPHETPDQAQLVTAGDDGTARLWQISGKTASALSVLQGHRGRVRSAQFSPDGRLVLTAGEDKTARLWDVATGQPAGVAGGVLRHPEAVLFATFSPDGSQAITGCDDNNAYVWNLAGLDAGKVKFTLQGHTAAVTSAAISPTGRRAVTGSQDGIAKLWDVEAGKEILSLKRHTAELTSVHFAPDGSSVLTSSLDRTAIVWPAVKIGPSLKLSSARLEIPRSAGLHRLDPLAHVVDPDASDLGDATLKLSLAGESGGAVPALDIAEEELADAGARVVRIAGGIELRLPAAATTEHVQQLLRAAAIRQEQPLARPLTLVVQIIGTSGELLSEARATVQAAEVEETSSLASATNK